MENDKFKTAHSLTKMPKFKVKKFRVENQDMLFNAETGLVFKDKKLEVVGRVENGDFVEFDQICLDLCEKHNRKHNQEAYQKFLEESQEVDEDEDEDEDGVEEDDYPEEEEEDGDNPEEEDQEVEERDGGRDKDDEEEEDDEDDEEEEEKEEKEEDRSKHRKKSRTDSKKGPSDCNQIMTLLDSVRTAINKIEQIVQAQSKQASSNDSEKLVQENKDLRAKLEAIRSMMK